MIWNQVYNPTGSAVLSTFLAALLGLAVSLAVAVLAFGMPAGMAGLARPRGRHPALRVLAQPGAGLMGGLIVLQAYAWPFTEMVVGH